MNPSDVRVAAAMKAAGMTDSGDSRDWDLDIPERPEPPLVIPEGVDARAVLAEHEQRIRFMARRFAHHGVDFDDCMQVGRLGCLRALEKYKPGRASFWTVARFHVLGAMSDHARRIWWMGNRTADVDTDLLTAESNETKYGPSDMAELADVLDKLPPIHRDVLEVYYLEGVHWLSAVKQAFPHRAGKARKWIWEALIEARKLMPEGGSPLPRRPDDLLLTASEEQWAAKVRLAQMGCAA